MMLSSVKLTKTLPALEKEIIDWLPVDIAGLALVQGIDSVGGSGAGLDVLHVLNENRAPKWSELLGWLKKQVAFDSVSPREWVLQLEDVHNSDDADHPAFKLLDLWKKAYAGEQIAVDHRQDEAADNSPFSLVRTKRTIPALRDVQPVDEEYFLNLWQWIDTNM